MATFTVNEIVEVTGGKVLSGSRDRVFTGVSIDSRTISEGELFIPLRGRRFDGHEFLMDALEKGSGSLVDRPSSASVEGKTVILVADTLKALQGMARHIRMKRRITVVGVTGTNGKTTTKELIASMLRVRRRILKNEGNLNNQIGLPLSLMKIGEDHEVAVLEMGASARGDIRELCEIAVPDFGVITNIGMGHLEGFGSLEGVRRAKLELFDAVKAIVVNADDRFLMEGIAGRRFGSMPKVLTFGISSPAEVYAQDVRLSEKGSSFRLCISGRGSEEVRLPVPGRFNILNALAAAALCSELGVGLQDIREGIGSFAGVPMRLEIRELPGALVMSDVYNANPVSMEEALKELVRLRKKRTIAVLGDMLELGSYAEEAHRSLGRWMTGVPVDLFIAVGPLMAKAAEEFTSMRERGGLSAAVTAGDAQEARKVLFDLWREGDTVLVKGSRGMRMEEVLDGFPGRLTVRTDRQVQHAV